LLKKHALTKCVFSRYEAFMNCSAQAIQSHVRSLILFGALALGTSPASFAADLVVATPSPVPLAPVAKPSKANVLAPVNPPAEKPVTSKIPSTGSVLTSVPQADPATLPLTVGDAVDRAIQANQNVLYYRERIDEADSGISYAKSSIFPVLNGVVTGEREKDAVNLGSAKFGGSAYNNYSAQITLVQPLYRAGLISGGIGVAEKEKAIRTEDLETTERDLTLSVIEAFYTVLESEQLTQFVKQTLDVEQESLSTAQEYFRIGRGQLIDVLQIKTQIALLYPQLASAENTTKNSAAQLTALLHAGQTSNLNLSGDLNPVKTQEIAKLVATKKELPEITRNKELISQFDDTIKVQMSVNYPSLNIIGGIGRTAYTQSDLFNDYSTGWSIGLQLNIPLFSGLSSIFQRHVLARQAGELEYQYHYLLDTLSSNQVQAERNLDTAATVLQSSQSAAEFSAASLREAQRDFRLQTISYLQLLTSQQSYLQAESSYVQAKYSYIDSVAKYFVATGIPISGLVTVLTSR
jgi:outer membrane protein